MIIINRKYYLFLEVLKKKSSVNKQKTVSLLSLKKRKIIFGHTTINKP